MVRGYMYNNVCRFCGTQEQKTEAAKTKARQEKKYEEKRKRQKSADNTQPDTLAKPGEGLSLPTHTQDNMHSQKRFQLRHNVPHTS